jgi:hypothetical protein
MTKTQDRSTIVFDGVEFTYKAEHGSWFEDPERESVGTLYAAANADGTFAEDSVDEIEFTRWDVEGDLCDAACALCREWQMG